jgi:hypothetical protein
LLAWLADFPGYKFCTARQLINRHDPKTLLGDGKVLVIDALDEVSAQKDGDAVDLVLRQLGKLGYPKFVLSCRVADWRNATGCEAIHEQYSNKPLVLHLEAFSDADALIFLSETLGSLLSERVINHFNDRGLNGLLGNPQTLELIARVAGAESLPESRGELFEQAIEVLRVEHRESKVGEQPARELGLSAAGAGFAALILTGNEAIVRVSAANAAEGELQLAEIACLPGVNEIENMLGTRLFKAYGSADRFSYLHRRVGEYLGAQWLAKQADTPRKRKRLLALFHGYGLVPASLRGIHAWLARDPFLAQAVIAADPMGVVEYGDADELTVEQARALISALELLAASNPRFRGWGPYSLRGILKPALIDDLRRLIVGKNIPFGLRRLVLEAIKGSDISLEFSSDFREILLDSKDIFVIRSEAGKALVELEGGDYWPSVVETLYSYDDQDSVRLALELMDSVSYEGFSDELIVDLLIINAKMGIRTVGVLWNLERHLPVSRIAGVLDCLTQVKKKIDKQHELLGNDAITDFSYHLIARALAVIDMTAEKVWSWLEQLEISDGHNRETRLALDAYIGSNDVLRREIQRLVLIDLPGESNLFMRSWDLNKRLSGFVLSSADIIALFDALDSENHCDERWRDVVQLASHDGADGEEVRAAARVFATHNPEWLEWLDGLAHRPPPEWKVEEDRRQHEYQKEQAINLAKNRASYEKHIQQIRAGEFGYIVGPAMAYLKLFSNVGQDVPAHERVAQWLGDEIGTASHIGFENYLLHHSSSPSANDIAQIRAEGKMYDAEYIIIAALAERHRNKVNFDKISDERLMAGLFALRFFGWDSHAGICGVSEAVEAALKSRGIWEEVMRRLLEPQLNAKIAHLSGLYELMHDEAYVYLSSKLAAEWLARFDDLPAQQEMELIHRLMRSGCFDDLRNIAASRNGITDFESRRRWDAVGLLVDFEQAMRRLSVKPIERELLWQLRDCIGGRYGKNPEINLTNFQYEWIISTFRSLWPRVEHPSGGTSGESNPWDAAEYIVRLIRSLGNDPSYDAAASLERLLVEQFDGYSEYIKVVIAEQKQVRVEISYFPPALDTINVILGNQPPVYSSDLQALIVELLVVVQSKIKSDDVDSWRGFYDEKSAPVEEERCRDHLIGLLRQEPDGIAFEPEVHVANDKRVDIACSVGRLRMPIEIKGQWHKDLWQGADIQLDARYANDWRAEGRGIYLVLWFGEQLLENKRLKSQGREAVCPGTPGELQNLLTASSQSAREGRVVVFVLDLTRSQP